VTTTILSFVVESLKSNTVTVMDGPTLDVSVSSRLAATDPVTALVRAMCSIRLSRFRVVCCYERNTSDTRDPGS
jgi:hypothetical protein